MSQSIIDSTTQKHNMLVLNEEQQLLKDSAREFLKKKSPVSALRKLRDTNDEHGYSPALWNEMMEMGWGALAFQEEYGGLDFGYFGMGIILEEMGRTLNASPMISSILMGGAAISIAGNEDQKATLLPAIAMGEKILTIALEEGPRHNPDSIHLSAQKSDGGYVLNGKKHFVMDGHIADHFVVAANTDKGTTLFLVNKETDGVIVERVIMVDSRNSATLTLDNVTVPEENILGGVGEGKALLDQILDISRIGISAELLGVISEAFERTINYLKERKQFGVPIGVFQALQHRAAIMFCEIELCQSVVMKSLQAIDNEADNLAMMASLTKAKVSQTAKLVTNEAVQLFGGIGMTDDEEIGFFLKRARVLQQMLGDEHFHLDRFASLRGY